MNYFKAPAMHRRAIWPWFVLATGLLIGGFPWLPTPYNGDTIILAAVGGLWALAFYLHSRHGEDARFTKELMTEFNERYDQINNQLQTTIWSGEPFDKNATLTFIKYFNLCAEEWLFAKIGYIYEPVWDAWCSGMHHYAKDDRVIILWEKERLTESYYGFEFHRRRHKNPRKHTGNE